MKENGIAIQYKRSGMNIYNTLLLFLLLMLPVVAQAQTDKEKKLQQMEQEIDSGNMSDEERFSRYHNLTWDYFTIDVDKTLYYCRKGIAFAREKKNVQKEAEFLTSMGEMYDIFDVLDSVFFYFDKALELIEGKEYYISESENYIARGNFYLKKNDHGNALKAYLKAIELNNKDKERNIANKQSISSNLQIEVSCIGNISSVYGAMYNGDKQIEYLLRAIKIMEDNPNITWEDTEVTYGNLAMAYMNSSEFDKAFPFIEKSYKLAVSKEAHSSIIFGLICYARYYSSDENNNNYKKSIDYAKQALQIAEKRNMPYEIFLAKKFLVRSYLFIKDYKTALYYAEPFLSNTDVNDWESLQEDYIYLSLIYAGMGDMKQAYKYKDEYEVLMGKISDGNLHNALQEMEVKYEVQQKELEITRKQEEINRQRNIFVACIAVTLLIICFTVYIIVLRNRRNRALAETNAIKDKFFSIIAHDLKNPVVTQHNALQLLTSNATKWDANTLSDYSEKLFKQSEDLVDLLKNLLNWSLIQSGRNRFQPSMFNLVAALQSDINLIRSMVERKNIAFETLTPKIAIVTADQSMLVTVVRNLLANAVKFTADGGTVTLEITPCLGAAERHTISVTDTGIGMSEEHIRNLFRLESAHSHQGTAGEQGSALGLIVCKELLEKHGSTLYVESTEGVGSRFWFEI